MKDPLEQSGARTKPGAALESLAARLAQRRASDQGFSGIRPAVGMSVAQVVCLQPAVDPPFKLRRTVEVTAFEELPRQDAEEQLHLVEPRAVQGREVEHVFVVGVAEKRPSLLARFQLLGRNLHAAP